jgi:hypothetical protein
MAWIAPTQPARKSRGMSPSSWPLGQGLVKVSVLTKWPICALCRHTVAHQPLWLDSTTWSACPSESAHWAWKQSADALYARLCKSSLITCSRFQIQMCCFKLHPRCNTQWIQIVRLNRNDIEWLSRHMIKAFMKLEILRNVSIFFILTRISHELDSTIMPQCVRCDKIWCNRKSW